MNTILAYHNASIPKGCHIGASILKGGPIEKKPSFLGTAPAENH